MDGEPGTGKTTLALQFLMEGVSLGERGLYVTLSESRAELLEVAQSHGWTLDGIEIYELGEHQERTEEEGYTLFSSGRGRASANDGLGAEDGR